jgi:hypothetical protein
MTNKQNAPRLLGKHEGCGGEVFYIKASASFCYRECKLCKQNGMYGTLSPQLETENKLK